MWARALGAHVIGFEPNPVNRIRLCESLGLNGWTDGRIHIFGNAVGEEKARLTLISRDLSNPGAAELVTTSEVKSLKEAEQVNGSPRFVNWGAVDLVTLDDVMRREGWLEPGALPIALLKVDVEGHDPQVFFGARSLLKSGIVHNIFMEYSCNKSDERDMNSATELLESEGYTIRNIGAWNRATIKGAKELVSGDLNSSLHVTGSFASRLFKFCKSGVSGSQQNIWWALDASR